MLSSAMVYRPLALQPEPVRLMLPSASGLWRERLHHFGVGAAAADIAADGLLDVGQQWGWGCDPSSAAQLITIPGVQ